MTCIVGLEADGRVWIGGDSAGVSGWSLTVRGDEKVFRNGPFVMGFTSSFRMGQLLRYSLKPPTHPNRMTSDKFMSTVFVDEVRQVLKDGGFAKTENSVESGGTFLVGYNGRLYAVHDDYQIGRPASGFDAVGCGCEIAVGALYASEAKTPRAKVTQALRAAEQFSAGVRGPFRVVSA